MSNENTTENYNVIEMPKEVKFPFVVNGKVVEALRQHMELKEKMEMQVKESQDKLWELVHDEYPDLNVDENYMLDSEHIEGDIVLLNKHKRQGLDGLLEKMFNKSKS